MKPEGLSRKSFSRWSIYHLQTSLLVFKWCCYASYSVLFPNSYLRWSESQLEALYCVQKPRCVLHQCWLQHLHRTGDRRQFLSRGAVLEVVQVSWSSPHGSAYASLRDARVQVSCVTSPTAPCPLTGTLKWPVAWPVPKPVGDFGGRGVS